MDFSKNNLPTYLKTSTLTQNFIYFSWFQFWYKIYQKICSLVQFLYPFQQKVVNLGLGHKNSNPQFLPCKPDTLTTLVQTPKVYIYSVSRKRCKMQTNYIKLVQVLEYATDSCMWST
jgi:hypothetical protein